MDALNGFVGKNEAKLDAIARDAEAKHDASLQTRAALYCGMSAFPVQRVDKAASVPARNTTSAQR